VAEIVTVTVAVCSSVIVLSFVCFPCQLFLLFFCPTFPFEVVASLWAAKPRRRVQHKERKPRAKVSKETGPMLNDDDGQDTDWSSFFDESRFQSQGTSSSDSLSSISSSEMTVPATVPATLTVLTIVPDQPAVQGFKLCPALPCPGPGPATCDM
jgi:hypothetical protein